MFKPNPLLLEDSYKLGHMAQYPEGTEFVYVNMTARSNTYLNIPNKTDSVTFVGLSMALQKLKEIWDEHFFSLSREEIESRIIPEFMDEIAPFVGPSGFDTSKIIELWEYQKLPISVLSFREGSQVPIRIPMFTIVNTDPRFYWFPNFIETYISAEVWPVVTAATIARSYRVLLEDAAERTGSPKEFVPFQAHDFSMRGLMGAVDAPILVGTGHLSCFTGSDTISAARAVKYFYPPKSKETLIAASVPATEHSVMTMGTEKSEIETYRRLIEDVYPAGIVSIVSDTWDFWKVLTEYTVELKQTILNRKPDALGNVKVVFRPDSGDPADILCGNSNVYNETREFKSVDEVMEWGLDTIYDMVVDSTDFGQPGDDSAYLIMRTNLGNFKISADVFWNRYDKTYYYFDELMNEKIEEYELTPADKGAVEVLWDIFGGTITSSSFKVLDSHVGLIYGDSITPERCKDILSRLEKKGFASCNVGVGVGSYTYQYNTRDTLGIAIKATWGMVDGAPRNISKNPKTDSGVKKSASGLLAVSKTEDGYILKENLPSYDYRELNKRENSAFVELFEDGEFKFIQHIEDIREIINNELTCK